MAFTEFYCDAAAGANINAGDKTANGVVTSSNGAWSTVTNIFTATAGTPFSGVSVGDFCALYADGATVAAYIAIVTAIGGGGLTLTLDTTAIAGTPPTTAGTGISATTGGAWKGPNGASSWPFTVYLGALRNAAGQLPRINLKSGTTYSITATIAPTTLSGANLNFILEGYTSSPGDGGRSTIDGGTTGASYNLLLFTAVGRIQVKHLILGNNGATGSAAGIAFSASGLSGNVKFRDVVVHDVRGSGVSGGSSTNVFESCEFYGCNQSNTDGLGGISSITLVANNCNFHDNTGSGVIVDDGNSTITNCIFDTNTVNGVIIGPNTFIKGGDFYNNGGSGVQGIFGGGSVRYTAENCNFIKNGGYGVDVTGTPVVAELLNCGFGSGTQANASGKYPSLTNTAVFVTGEVVYATDVTPWVDPANGDFRINLSAAKGAGYGVFTETAASYAGTVGYPDIGAAQHQDSGGSGGIGGVLIVGSSAGRASRF